MLQSLKRKARQRILPLLVLLGAALLISLYWLAPAVLQLVRGPLYFDPMEPQDLSSLQGQYLEADILTLLDYYAQTTDSKTRSLHSREYLMPVVTADGDYLYIGVEVPRSKVADAEAVVSDTQRLLYDDDYEWDGSYVTVRGTLRPMDDETAELYAAYLTSGDDIAADEIGLESGTFRTLVLVDGTIGSFDDLGTLALFCLIWVLFLIAWIVLLRNVTGGYQEQLTRYLAALPDPETAEQQLDLLYEDPEAAPQLHISRNWLLYTAPLSPWALAADDVVWAYTHTIRHKQGLLTVSKSYSVEVCSATEPPKRRCHSILAKSEEEAQSILELLHRTYPNAVTGWSAEYEKAYKADPAAFHRQAAAAAQQTAAFEPIPGAAPED